YRVCEVRIGASPTCSAFSTLRRIFDGLSGPGNGSSVPPIESSPVRNIWEGQLANCSYSLHTDLGSKGWVLEHYRTVPELLHKAVFALNRYQKLHLTRVGHLGDFVTVKPIPTMV
ncbi:MAG: hypothetical protein Q9177_005841, partial [Variospora cf. flavescens]